MKKAMVLLWCIICVIGLAACSKNRNPINSADNKDAGKTVLQMELDKNYDISDPFVNARLFAISLNNVQKDKEYAIWFTGTKIENARIAVTFENDLVQERERPES